MKIYLLAASSLLLCLGLVLAQNAAVTGLWLAKGVNRTIKLTLNESAGMLSGTLEGMGETFSLNGRLTGMKAEGTATSPNGEAYFMLEIRKDVLSLTLANYNEAGTPDLKNGVTVQLERDFGPKAQTGFTVPGFAPPPEDPLIATWRNSSLVLTLKSNGANKYTGTIEIAKQKASLTATGNPSNLKGSFKLGKTNKTFSAKLEVDRLRFVMDGKTQILGRVR